jgi:Lar family restriction alleviation protein
MSEFRSALKPCPFCGSQAKLMIGSNGSEATSDYFVECTNEDCGILTPLVYGHHEDGECVVEIWNRRTP